jgi:NhaA family Na+:H+ antiporter
LANAGVHLGGTDLSDPTALRLGLGVSLGLVLGKPIGVLLASFLAVRVGIASLPRGISWKNLSLVGGVAGIGFTMAIFIAGLAFTDNGKLAVAKLAVLVGTTIAAVVSLALGRFLLPATSVPGTAETVDEAEQSTDS